MSLIKEVLIRLRRSRKMISVNFSESVIYFFFLVVAIEILACFILLLLIGSSKAFFPQYRAYVAVTIEDFPHPLVKAFKAPKELGISGEPNIGYYMPKTRYGATRTWIEAPHELDNTLNIVLLGGSTIEGDGAKTEEKTIAAQLERLLNENRSTACMKVKVINEGVSGYQRKQQFLLLTTAILPRVGTKIEMVINVDGINDFLSFVSSRRLVKSPFYKTHSTRELELASIIDEFLQTGKVKSREFAILNSTFIGLLAKTTLKFLVPSNRVVDMFGHNANLEIFDSEIEDRAQQYKDYGRFFSAVLATNGISYLEVLQPYLGFKSELTHNELLTRTKYFPKSFWEKFDSYYLGLRERSPQTANSVDLSDYFRGQKDEMFIDHVHYSEGAQLLIAREIFNRVVLKLPCSRQAL